MPLALKVGVISLWFVSRAPQCHNAFFPLVKAGVSTASACFHHVLALTCGA